MNSDGTFFMLYALLLLLYFLPWFIAGLRRHHQQWAILALNLLLGWTVLGWIGALVWSLTAHRTWSRREFTNMARMAARERDLRQAPPEREVRRLRHDIEHHID